MNFIKWFAVIFCSLMAFWVVSWLVSLYVIKSGIDAVNSIQHSSLDSINQQQAKMARDMIKDTRALFPVIKVPPKTLKVAKIKFTEAKVITADKLCNDAILAAMGDRSNEAQQTKNRACAHNIK